MVIPILKTIHQTERDSQNASDSKFFSVRLGSPIRAVGLRYSFGLNKSKDT